MFRGMCGSCSMATPCQTICICCGHGLVTFVMYNMLLSIHSYLHDPIQKQRRNLGLNESCLLGPMSKLSREDWSSPKKKYLVIELKDSKNDVSCPVVLGVDFPCSKEVTRQGQALLALPRLEFISHIYVCVFNLFIQII